LRLDGSAAEAAGGTTAAGPSSATTAAPATSLVRAQEHVDLEVVFG